MTSKEKMKQTEIGEIPESWEVKPFSELCSYITGKTPSRNNPIYWNKGTVPWLTISDMKQGRFISNTKEKISREAMQDCCTNKLVHKGTLLMSFKLTIGRTSFAGCDLVHNEAIISIYPKDELDKIFISYYLPTINYKEYQDRQIKGNTLNQSKINRIRIPVPPLVEQKKIAAVLSKIQKNIDIKDELIKVTQELKKSTMNYLFTYGTQGEKTKQTKVGEIPKSWEILTLSNLVKKTNQVSMAIEGKREIAYIDVSSIEKETLKVKSVTNYILEDAPGRARKKIYTNDVIFATVRPYLLRAVYILGKYDNQICSTAFCVLRAKKNTIGRFIFYLVQREAFIKQLESIQSGANYPAVTDKQVKAQVIPVPSLAEQKKIASILCKIDERIQNYEAQKHTLQALFKSMLSKLMTGQIRVHELDIDTAEIE